MTDLERSGFNEFDRLLVLVQRTREVLDELLGHGELPAGGADYLATSTLPHLEGVEEGLRGWLRAEHADLVELRYLVLQAADLRVQSPRTPAERRAAASETAAQRSLTSTARPRVEAGNAWNLAAAAHARLVLASLPRLSALEVRYPAGRRTYADIPAPRGPAELMARIEEIERELWRTATGRLPHPMDQPFRRTYGFFDAAERFGGRAFRT